jgi:hypothetical protein
VERLMKRGSMRSERAKCLSVHMMMVVD